MDGSPHPLLESLAAALRRPWLHFLLLLGFALALYGHALGFGLIYDDHLLLHANHLRWFTSPWEYEWYYRPGELVAYYRPLQALLFAPAVVSPFAPLLHAENLVVATLIVFLFGRVLLSLELELPLVAAIEIAGIALPTSMALFVWISQRTDWLTYGLGLLLAWIALARAPRPLPWLLGFVLLAGAALFAKESGLSLLVLAPLLLLLRGRRGLALATVAAGAALFLGYATLRSTFVPDSGTLLRSPLLFAGRMLFGLLQVFVYSWLPVCFTSNPLDLGLALVYGGCAFLGLSSLWRRRRTVALALLALFAAYALGTTFHPVPRNLVLTGLVVAALAGCGAARLLETMRERGGRGLDLLLLALGLCALGRISLTSSYALQDWIEPINTRLEAEGWPRRGLLHPIDMNVPFPPEAPDSAAAKPRGAPPDSRRR